MPDIRDASVTKSFKEKFVTVYDSIFKGEQPWVDNEQFWDELFLLKLNSNFLLNLIKDYPSEQTKKLKTILNFIFEKCTTYISDKNVIRQFHAIRTLCCLVRAVAMRTGFAAFGFDSINLLCDFNEANNLFRKILLRLQFVFLEEGESLMKTAYIEFLVIVVMVTDNINDNTLMEYVMMTDIFESIMSVFLYPELRQKIGYQCMVLLVTFLQYRKYESCNPYSMSMSVVDNEILLTAMARVFSSPLVNIKSAYEKSLLESQNSSWIWNIKSYIGSYFVQQSSWSEDLCTIFPNYASLLALYECVHLNRNFISVLTFAGSTDYIKSRSNSSSSDIFGNTSAQSTGEELSSFPSLASSSILVAFIQFCSIVMQNLKNEMNLIQTKLSFLILLCICEDQYANSVVFDENISFIIPIYLTPMHHRKSLSISSDTPKPMVCAIYDLLTEFIYAHLMKCFPFELYHKALDILYHLITFQKKTRVRLTYSWMPLWTSLIGLLRFLVTNECEFTVKFDICEMAWKAVKVLNFFISLGDAFLPDADVYDCLYYELIRERSAFDGLYNFALRLSSHDVSLKNSASKLSHSLFNIRSILSHFCPKIDEAITVKNSPLTQEEVFKILRDNYDALKLKRSEFLEYNEVYNEKQTETSFFSNVMRAIIKDYMSRVHFDDSDVTLLSM